MKYYKKKKVKVEIVDKYEITKIMCCVCYEDIKAQDSYCEITEYPNYPEDSLCTNYCHEKCLLKYIEKNYHDHIEIEKFEYFYPYETDDIDDFDVEIDNWDKEN